MKPLPEIPPGPEAWKRFASGVLAALRARTPLRSPTAEIDEKNDGFFVLPKIPAARRLVSPLFFVTANTTVSPLGYATITIPAPGVADHTPIAIETGSATPSEVIFTQQYVSGENITVRVYNPDTVTTYTLADRISARVLL
jgi:hypothetical protein